MPPQRLADPGELAGAYGFGYAPRYVEVVEEMLPEGLFGFTLIFFGGISNRRVEVVYL